MKKPHLLYISAALFALAAILGFVDGNAQLGGVWLVLALAMTMAGYRMQKRGKILD